MNTEAFLQVSDKQKTIEIFYEIKNLLVQLDKDKLYTFYINQLTEKIELLEGV